MFVSLSLLASWLERRLGREKSINVLYRSSERPVNRLVLALEPREIPVDTDADALFLHRPFELSERFPGLGVLASHDPFDDLLTTNFNLTLARALNWKKPRRLRLEERTVGTVADLESPLKWEALLETLEQEFGGWEELLTPRELRLERLVLMSTFRPEAVRLAARVGAQVYLTGQMRPAGQTLALELGLGVVALGHRRSELWGLNQLARELSGAFPALELNVMGSTLEPFA